MCAVCKGFFRAFFKDVGGKSPGYEELETHIVRGAHKDCCLLAKIDSKVVVKDVVN